MLYIPLHSSKYLLSNSITDIYNQTNEDIVIVEYPNLESNNVPTKLLQEANINLLILSADRAWRNTDQVLFERLKSQIGKSNLATYLNHAESRVIENYTGMLPPYTYIRKLTYRISQLGLTARTSAINKK